jgi:hypothetical protein
MSKKGIRTMKDRTKHFKEIEERVFQLEEQGMREWADHILWHEEQRKKAGNPEGFRTTRYHCIETGSVSREVPDEFLSADERLKKLRRKRKTLKQKHGKKR